MNADAEQPSPPPIDAKRKRGRPRQSAAENHQQRVERLEAELKEARAAAKAAEEKRAAIIGTASLRHVRQNVEFARQLAAMLHTEVKAKADRAAITDLMREPGPSAKSG